MDTATLTLLDFGTAYLSLGITFTALMVFMLLEIPMLMQQFERQIGLDMTPRNALCVATLCCLIWPIVCIASFLAILVIVLRH